MAAAVCAGLLAVIKVLPPTCGTQKQITPLLRRYLFARQIELKCLKLLADPAQAVADH